jgi:hypothetical protein
VTIIRIIYYPTPLLHYPNFLVSVTAALIAYTYKEKLPSLNLRVKELDKLLPALV